MTCLERWTPRSAIAFLLERQPTHSPRSRIGAGIDCTSCGAAYSPVNRWTAGRTSVLFHKKRIIRTESP